MLTSGVAVANQPLRRLSEAPFVDSLSPEQVKSFLDFVESAQFENVVRQATIAYRDYETRFALRAQLHHGLRHRGGFKESELYMATDTLEELMNTAVDTVRRLSPTGSAFETGRDVAAAASVAAAAVRNGELLARIATIAGINEFGNRLRSAARFGHEKLEVAASSARRRVDYSQLYVDPRLRPSASLPPLITADPSFTVTLADLLDGDRRCVVLGDPGAGKSTLSAKLTHDLAADRLDGLEGQIPVLLRVREHTRSLRAEHHPLLHYLEASCRRPHNTIPPPDALEYFLLNGQATVIIDGIDELGDTADRRSFLDLVEGFIHLFPLARVVVTSRTVGYTDAALDIELFPIFQLQPFDQDQVRQYADNWFKIDEAEGSDGRGGLVEAFMHESEPAADLRSNALLLSLLCSLYSARRSIPNNRPEIYNRCANLLFETWDRQRGIEVLHRYEASIRPAVQKMALHLFTDSRARQALPRSEWARFLADYLHARRFSDMNDAEAAASDFLEFCAGRAWVITDVASDQFEPHYGFVHRTFLEYFAAAQLVKERPRPAAVLDKIAPYLGEGSWRVTAQLAVQILNETFEDGADELLKIMLIAMGTSAHYAKAPQAYLNFMAELLEIVAPYSDTVEVIVDRIVLAACHVPQRSRLTVPELLGTSDDVPTRLAGRTDEALVSLINVTSPDNMERIADAISDRVREYAASMPIDSSAGLLYTVLSAGHFATSEVGDRVAKQLALLETPPAAARWQQLANLPTVEDLEARGFHLLFQRALCLGRYLPTPLNAMIGNYLALPESSAQRATELRRIDSTLASYLPFLEPSQSERLTLSLEPAEVPDDTWVWLVQQPGMLSQKARQSLAILLWGRPTL